MPRPRRAWIAFLFASATLASTALAAPDFSGSISAGAGAGTDHKPQSKLWFNDGAWWGVFYDGSTQHIWKLEEAGYVKQIYPDAAVDARAGARCDVLWDGTYLYVLAHHQTLPKFSKYSYDTASQTYHRLPGFPVDLPFAGIECMVLDKDSTGRLWVSFEMGQAVHVIWTTSPDHLAWDFTGTVIETQVGSDDITSTVAFGGDKIGVLWSDQGSDATWRFGFRVHRDTDAPDVWQPIETIDTGSAVDDHINIKADADGRLWFAGKNVYNTIQVYTRAPAGGWTLAFSDINRGNCTRPCVEIDETQNAVHVFYTDWIDSPNPIKVVTAPRSTGVFGTPQVYLTPGSSSSLNDVTGTKQRVSVSTGYAVAASGGSTVYWGLTNLDTDSPALSAVNPTADQAGVALQPVLQYKATDAGVGVRRSTVTLALDGVPVTPTIAGNAAQYLVSYQPATPLDAGRVYTVTMTAKDGAFPPHSTSASFRFKTAFTPGPLAEKVNFQPASGAAPAGYDIDSGAQYTLERGTGWDKTMTLKRANLQADVRLDTYVERKNSSTKATWSYDVANGVYRIAFAAGAPDAGGKQRIEVEGQLLLNNQVTSSGQFINISGYDVTVQDGQLNVRIGGAGGSTKTQLCYFEFTYQGEAPPPPPPGGAAPKAVTNVVIAAAAGSSLGLRWAAVTEDTTGALTAITRYHVYRGTTPAFLPDRSGHSNRVGVVVTAEFTDVGALNAAGDQYYIVTAENASGLESRRASNLAMRRRVSVDPAGAPSRTLMIALPSVHAYPDAAGLAAGMNGGTSGPVMQVASIDRATQVRREWSRTAGTWSGTNFSILPGDAIEVTVGSAWQWNLLGAELAAPTFSFAFHNATGNVNWVSLPQNAVYTSAQNLTQALNGGTGLGPVTKVAWMNSATGRMESWLWFAGAWRGNNFPLPAGQGVAILVGADVPAWSPQLRQP